MGTRYSKAKQIINDSAYYEPLRKDRERKAIKQYATLKLNNPTVPQRASLKSSPHIWKYGDRLSNLAFRYYGDAEYWWVIAWWNAYGIEADIPTGATLSIPLSLTAALDVLGV